VDTDFITGYLSDIWRKTSDIFSHDKSFRIFLIRESLIQDIGGRPQARQTLGRWVARSDQIWFSSKLFEIPPPPQALKMV
jgi:hypothetical protein